MNYFVPLQPEIKYMKQSMILAAGLGTRLKPLTDTMPKALVPVGGTPLLDINIRKLQSQGYDRFVVNVHHFAQQIVDHIQSRWCGEIRGCVGAGARGCENSSSAESNLVPPYLRTPVPPTILISDETDALLETGGGLKKAQQLFRPDEPILIHNVDILDNVDYAWFARQHQADEDAVLLVSRRQTKRYLLFDNAMRLMGWMNRETGEIRSPFPWLRSMELAIDDDLNVISPSSLLTPPSSNLHAFAFSGIHSFSPRLFPLMDRFPDRFSIIDFYLSTCHRARIVGLVKDDLRLMDVGKLDTLHEAEDFLKSLNQ